VIQIIWDTRGYFFWLLVVSALCLVLERIRPWRREQKVLRQSFFQDLFWLLFNGHYAGILVAHLAAFALAWAIPIIEEARSLQVLAGSPIWLQLSVFFLLKDFLEWGIHNMLHRVRWLWEFHKVHHSIQELDWIGNFRFHWMEIVVYQGLSYFPLVILGVDRDIVLVIAVVATLIGHLNHSNLDISWGPLRYVLNSPRMHVWHHDHDWPADRPHGMNFAVCLSLWDWLFGTAYWPDKQESPAQQPQRLGFPGMERFPRSLLARLLHPITRLWSRRREIQPMGGRSAKESKRLPSILR
jgi:sterol desaturase/sphingolipid hydroxylase (fatty acid hydroxylase superfamily)